MISIVKYDKTLKIDWDQFLLSCKKKHFMFYRDYMEYHEDRFTDHSLLFYKKNKIIALLPANEINNELWTHQGLTFGGILIGEKANCKLVLALFSALKEYMKQLKIARLVYKCIPRIYESLPSEEELYALFVNNAELIRRDCSVSIDMRNRISYDKNRSSSIRKAKKNTLSVVELSDFQSFWVVLNEVIQARHGANPIHSYEEITYLKNLFPAQIRCFASIHENKIVAGTLIYLSENVAHCQYLASNESGRQLGALDLVIDHLINNEFKYVKYFDFGISNERDGRYLNLGLISQKEGFGARSIVHDFYELKI